MSKKPVPARGMRDILPDEMALREETLRKIVSVYAKYGYARIETPAMENIDALSGSDGGENEKLIYHILKRGEKLDFASMNTVRDVVDYGLRFDLTVPLSRFYASNHQLLPDIFKAIQIGPVWRAERPQKGRFRQFTQCDIDIIGLDSVMAEAELITATSQALAALGFSGFTVRLNDRRILTALLGYCGFSQKTYDNVMITIDKLEKIGIDGIRDALLQEGQRRDAIEKLLDILAKSNHAPGTAPLGSLAGHIEREVSNDLEVVIDAVRKQSNGIYNIDFDLTLVRGMSYYTGQIFEIVYKDFPFSLAGGGRYDNMIGRMLGRDVPACGFSIGFERIITILQEESILTRINENCVVVFYEPDCSIQTCLCVADNIRKEYSRVTVAPKRKNMRKQLNDYLKIGFNKFATIENDVLSEIREIN